MHGVRDPGKERPWPVVPRPERNVGERGSRWDWLVVGARATGLPAATYLEPGGEGSAQEVTGCVLVCGD
jgi:hypothetical protein